MSYVVDILFAEVPWTSRSLFGTSYNIPGFLETLEPQNIFSCYLELLILIPAMIVVSIYVWVITTISLFHKNVVILLIWAYFWYFLGALARIPILLIQLHFFEDQYPIILFLASFLRIEFYICCPMTIPMVVIERVLATHFVSDYEKNHRVWISYLFLPIFFIFSQFLSLPLFLKKVLVIYGAIGMLFVCGLLGFFNILYWVNWRTLKKMEKNSMEYTLSKKYQIEENLRIMWFLRRIGISIIVFACLFTIVMLFPWKHLFDFQLNLSDVIVYLDVCIAGCSIIVPLIVFYTLYKSENSAFLRKIRWLFRIPLPLPQPTIQIAPVFRDESKVYFDQLQNSWK
ncbi:unnamed protein product [Caenorhabditis angaria]|uniref:Uncharacterized protein n=1 Tax=Caenorhabditis angaria TaxID=860376 RepID=A0A9P1IE05_9PELO|nr:unnamed protein product [Caenorhabditis angaria]